jgi:hypothetical protein
MKLIAHRGLINGTESGVMENHPAQIQFALTLGYDAEIDVWCLNGGKWYLGHDGGPGGITYEIPFSFLLQKGLWIHCKNYLALYELSKLVGTKDCPNFFWHEEDSWTLTSHGYIWQHVKNWDIHSDKAIVLLARKNRHDRDYTNEQLKASAGVCSKWVENLKKELT